MASVANSTNGDSVGIVSTITLGQALATLGRHATNNTKLTMDNGDVLNLLYTPDPLIRNGLAIGLLTTVGIDYELYEGADASGGTPVGGLNLNREKSDLPNVTITSQPTITNDGILIDNSSAQDRREVFDNGGMMIPDRTKKYLIRIISKNNSNEVEVNLDVFKLKDANWY